MEDGDRSLCSGSLVVSVCIPTYNGERHLRQQLESIAAQTSEPDEILVADDCSSDGTLNVVREFAELTSVPVRMLAATQHIGLCDNLRRLVVAAQCDIVCFSDQDDIWLPNKIETLLSYFDEPEIEAVCCDSRPFESETGSTHDSTVWSISLRGDSPEASLAVLWKKNFLSGHNIAIRREAMLRYIWPDGAQIFYDYWIALITSAKGTMALCPDVLTLYRQHEDNMIGISGRRGTARNIRNWTMTADTLDGVLGNLSSDLVEIDPAIESRMRERSRFMRSRVSYRQSPVRHLATPFRLAISRNGYRAFGNGWSSFFGDLFSLVDPSERLHSGLSSGAESFCRRPLTEQAGGDDEHLRLGVYVDLVFRRDQRGLSSTTPFVSWLARLGEEVDQLVLFGRVDPKVGGAAFELPSNHHVRFVELPYYRSLHDVRSVALAVLPSLRTWRREISSCDALFVFGPHPLSIVFEAWAVASRKPVFVGVRQNFAEYLNYRTTGRRRLMAGVAARAMQQAHLWLASAGAVVVGDEMASVYRSRGVTTLQSGISLLGKDEIRSWEEIQQRAWPGARTILVVGRLDPEKNPRLLLDLAAALSAGGSTWTLEVAGTGSMAEDIRREATERGLDNLTFHGQLPRERLVEIYRKRATIFLHVSLTEGQPQVLYEAAAFGLPIIATAVGGVPSALGHGERGLLVPPRHVGAILRAVEELDRAPAARNERVEAAWRWASEETIDTQAREVVSFIRDRLGRQPRADLTRRPTKLGSSAT